MLKKYVYFIPQGGINDCFVNIYIILYNIVKNIIEYFFLIW